ncbi:MAG TPA: DUF2239 family protein [Caulobacteraceae bacterium]|nr:DUF2239 family protein [Caulobacteraceae bacterium]
MTGFPQTCTAFAGDKRIATGRPSEVAVAVKRHAEGAPAASVLAFDDATGRPVDFDLQGSEDEVRTRLVAEPEEAPSGRPRGRPRLGVVAREVTLLPRHWDWLGAQPGGASVALRKLVEGARTAHRSADQVRQAQEATGRVMHAMAGDAAGYEEATRALYAQNAPRFAELIRDWPQDVRDYVLALSAAAFAVEA